MFILANIQGLLDSHRENNITVLCERRTGFLSEKHGGGNRTVKKGKSQWKKNELLDIEWKEASTDPRINVRL